MSELLSTTTSFLYHIHEEDSWERLTLVLYTKTKEGKTVILETSFEPFFYVEFPESFLFPPKKCSSTTKTSPVLSCLTTNRRLRQKLLLLMGYHEPFDCSRSESQGSCRFCWKGKFSFEYRKKLYFHQKRPVRPFLKVTFPSTEQRQKCVYRLHEKYMQLDNIKLFLRVHEQKAPSVLQFCSQHQLRTVGWIQWDPKFAKPVRTVDCLPFPVLSIPRHCFLMDEEETTIVFPSVCSFDIEVYSSNPKRMPSATHPEDAIFQIALIYVSGEGEKRKVMSTLFTLGFDEKKCTTMSKYGNGKILRQRLEEEWIGFDSEEELLLGFREWIHEWDPDVLIGYNIMGFDFPYVMDRCDFHHISAQVFRLGRRFPERICPCKEIDWSSAAYQHQHFKFWEMDGRVVMDLLPVIRRDYKLDNYKLDTVCHRFLQSTKDPVTPQDIFASYQSYLDHGSTSSTRQRLSTVGKYCLKDARLVFDLFEKLQLWLSLTEMAKLCSVSITSLFTKGQQIKVYSQIYRYCRETSCLVESTPSSLLESQDGYTGATVFPPQPGLYQDVIPFDFSSLYPTTIIAYNIDYSTFVPKERTDIPDSQCHVISWEEHTLCEHDLTKYTPATKPSRSFCGNHTFRFLKSPKGILPRVLEFLLDARKQTKKQMKHYSHESLIYQILDKRQLAYKVSANSMYGAMGVRRGYLPFMYGAMCTTAQGRASIQKAAAFVQNQYNGHIVYGDSVGASTPLLLRWVYEIDDSKKHAPFFLMRAQDLFHHVFCLEEEEVMMTQTLQGKTYLDLPGSFLQVWTENQWTDVRRVIEHPVQKTMYRVICRYGWVDVTEDHSLVRPDGSCFSPNHWTKEDESLFSFFSHDSFYSATTTTITNNNNHQRKISSFSLHECQRLGYQIATLFQEWSLSVSPFPGKPCFDPLGRHQHELTTKIHHCLQWGSFRHHVEFCKGWWMAYHPHHPHHHHKQTQKHCVLKMTRVFSYPLLWQCCWMIFHLQQYQTYLDVDPKTNECFWTILFSKEDDCNDLSSLVNPVISVFKITSKNTTTTMVYDLTTENHHFQAGVGHLIVHNTDSIYCRFPHIPLLKLWSFAKEVETAFLSLFPAPLKLVFEEKLYRRFLILTKKRYMALTCDEEEVEKNVQDMELTIRGVLLARRDNCAWIRQVYEKIVRRLLYLGTYEEVMNLLNEEVLSLFRREWTLDQFVVTKLVGKDYKIRELPEDPIKCQKRLESLGIYHQDEQGKWKQKYQEKSEPAHVQLARRIERRGGEAFEPGVRIPYVIIRHPDGNKAKLFDKTEDPLYVLQRYPLLTIDPHHYGKLLSKSVDQLFSICFPQEYQKKNTMHCEYLFDVHQSFEKVLKSLEDRTTPQINMGFDFDNKKNEKNEKKQKKKNDSSLTILLSDRTKEEKTKEIMVQKKKQKTIYDYL